LRDALTWRHCSFDLGSSEPPAAAVGAMPLAPTEAIILQDAQQGLSAKASSSRGGAEVRLVRFLSHILDAQPTAAAGQVQAATVSAEQSGGSFWKAVLAHLVLVPTWLAGPPLLLLGVLGAGASHGAKGLGAGLGLGAMLMATKRDRAGRQQRALACLTLAALAGSAKSGARRVRALAAVGLTSLLTWTVSTGSFAPRSWLYPLLSRHLRNFYAQAVVRGAVGDVQHRGSFFAFHPHGCLSAGWTINGGYNPEWPRIAGCTRWFIDTGLRQKNPLFRIMCDAYDGPQGSFEGADSASIRRFMERGDNVALIPGGFQDATIFEHGKERTFVRQRKGFVKYCLEFGYRLHPVWTFGEAETYHAFKGLQGLRLKLNKYNVPALLPFGWWPCPVLPLPTARLMTVVGPGIDLPKMPEPSSETVDHWHQVYMQALQQLFDQHKAEAGKPDALLELW